jgi:hypothetical protein
MGFPPRGAGRKEKKVSPSLLGYQGMKYAKCGDGLFIHLTSRVQDIFFLPPLALWMEGMLLWSDFMSTFLTSA